VCGYDLKVQPSIGDCPECGAAYTPAVLMKRRLPGPLGICLRFGWPFIPILASAMIDVNFMFLMAGSIALIINSCVQCGILVNRCSSPEIRARPWGRRLRTLNQGAYILFLVTMILPLVYIGSCVAIILSLNL
jgi:hypothetical protein